MKSTLIFLGLSAVAFAHTGIKSRLAQQAACTCSIPAGATSTGLPALGQAAYNGFNQAGQVTTGSTVSTIPDTEVLEQGASECCSCNTGSHSAASTAAKTRHYDITGSISIAESVEWAESGNSSSQSAGEANKQSSNAVSNVNNGGNGAPNGGCVSVCANNGTIAL
jgi:hypothetical protein